MYQPIKRLAYIPSYEDVITNYLVTNEPFIVTSEATETWRSRKDWVTEDGDGCCRPDLQYFTLNFGDCQVPVADCQKCEYSAQPKQTWTLCEYMEYMRKHHNQDAGASTSCYYLKDWHFQRAFPNYPAYTTPIFFTSDWLNEYWDRHDNSDDYRFVYIGVKGSWTPFHADVFHSFSWSANICGKKLWLIYPKGEEEKLEDQFGNLPFDVTGISNSNHSNSTSNETTSTVTPTITHEAPDNVKPATINDDDDTVLIDSPVSRLYIRDKIESSQSGQPLRVIQNQGEMIFIPSGWHHQVHNLEDTISINHNWLNACNVYLCWEHLKTSLIDVQKELSDLKNNDEWDNLCQKILKSNNGIDYRQFYIFMLTIATSRIATLKDILTQQDIEPGKSVCIKHCKVCDESLLCTSTGRCYDFYNDKKSDNLLAKSSEETQLLDHVSDFSTSHPCHIIMDLSQVLRVVNDMLQTREFDCVNCDDLDKTAQELVNDIRDAMCRFV